MKRYIRKTDLSALWEEDGDLQRMKAFFQTIEMDSVASEQIKQRVKQKVLDKMSRLEDPSELQVISNGIEKDKKAASLLQRIRRRLLTINSFGQWKFAASAVAIAILIFIGQEGINGSGSIFSRLGSTEKLAQSVGSPPQTADLNGSVKMGGEGNTRQKTFSDNKQESKSSGPKADTKSSTDNTSGLENQARVQPVQPDQAGVQPVQPDQAGVQPVQPDQAGVQPVQPDQAGTQPIQPDHPALMLVPPDQEAVRSADTKVIGKVIRNLDLTLEVSAVDEAVAKISQEAEQLGGYVVISQQSDSDQYSPDQLTVKIPADKLSVFQDSFSAWGKVLDQGLQANDITNKYNDSQGLLQILQAEEKGYLVTLNQAATADDVHKAEEALSNVRQQIEQQIGLLKTWDNQVDYSTVTLQIVTPKKPLALCN